MKKQGIMRNSLLVMLVLALVFTATACGNIVDKSESGSEVLDTLPAVGSYEKLLSILQKNATANNSGLKFDRSAVPEMANNDDAAPQEPGSGSDYSGTNVQVFGVDEADIVKTDGKYIYQVNGQRIMIIKAYPGDKMLLVNTIKIEDERFHPTELYLDDKYLVVIGSTVRYMPFEERKESSGGGSVPGAEPGFDGQGSSDSGEALPYSGEGEAPKDLDEIMPPDSGVDPDDPRDEEFIEKERRIADDVGYVDNYYYNTQGTIRVIVYNIEDPEKIEQVRDFEMDGQYVSSRKIDSQLYLVTNRYIYYWAESQMDEQSLIPSYRDSLVDDDFVSVSYSDIKYFPESQESNFLMIAGLNLENMDEKLDVETFLGSGQTVYASRENLYIAVTKWEYDDVSNFDGEVVPETGVVDSNDAIRPGIMPIMQPPKVNTFVYKFALENGRVTYAATGEVPGTLLNQFSMDEHSGHFRIATTSGEMWRDDEFTSKNNIYVLNAGMSIVGKIEDIAPGERIYSVRFMGDKGYMVTFKTVDPLFVIDLKDPKNPKILGELKIPGYSDYLHPYDENHIIGFGMDAIEAEIKDHNGKVIGLTAYQLGMKVAMFDVSDVNNPIEKFGISIGDRGTYSELLYNHKALLFSKDKNIMAFPVTVMEAKSEWMDREQNIPQYGEFVFQGIHVYSIDIDKGFTLAAEITHVTDTSSQTGYERWYGYESNHVDRALYIDDTLYTLSRAMIKAHSLNDFKEKGMLELEGEKR